MDNNTNHIEIQVFGETAKRITEGSKFIATVDSVEGHTVVTLKSIPETIEEITKLTDAQVKERFNKAKMGTDEYDYLAGEMIIRGLLLEASVI